MQILLGCLGVIILIFIVMFLAVFLLWLLNGTLFLFTWIAIIGIVISVVLILFSLLKKDYTSLKKLSVALVVLIAVFSIGKIAQPKLHSYLTESKDKAEQANVSIPTDETESVSINKENDEGTDDEPNNIDKNEEIDQEQTYEEDNGELDGKQNIEENSTKNEVNSEPAKEVKKENEENNELENTEKKEQLESKFSEIKALTNFIVHIEIENDSFKDYTIYVVNEVKMSSEEEKIYMVEEVGPAIQELVATDIGVTDIRIRFRYEDGKVLAEPKIFSRGWNVKN